MVGTVTSRARHGDCWLSDGEEDMVSWEGRGYTDGGESEQGNLAFCRYKW